MKLLQLINLDEIKNIPVGVFDFGSGNYTALVGANGSGKSNWIEAIAEVMMHLIEGDEPSFYYKLILDDDSRVEYTAAGGLKYYHHGQEVNKEALDLPKRLMVCYSGEDQRLWSDVMFNSYQRYFSSPVMMRVGEPPSLYVNRYNWAIAMIVLLCSEQPKIKAFVDELWGAGIQPNQIKVDVSIDPNAKGYRAIDAQNLLAMIQREMATAVGLYVSHFKSFTIGAGGQPIEEKCCLLYYLLYALSMPVPRRGNNIQLQKAILDVKLTRADGLELAGLSEGHKKRILIMLLTRVLGDEDTVCLLDEPDAHVDLMTKKKIVELISSAKGHVVLTTHSPVMTRYMLPDAVKKVEQGQTNSAAWKQIFTQLSGGEIAGIDTFLFTLNKKVVITEGPYDIRYIHKAAELLKIANPDIEPVEDVPSYCIGGTGMTKFFIDNTLDPLVGFFDKILFLFDRDEAGRKGYDEVVKYLRQNPLYSNKISALMYAEDLDVDPGHDFLVEDYFPATCYNGKGNVPDINLNGNPPYYDLKKFNSVQDKVKSFIEGHYKDADFDAAVYAKFLPLLKKIVEKLDL